MQKIFTVHVYKVKLEILPVCSAKISSVQFISLTNLVIWRDMTDDSAEILFQSFLQEAVVGNSGTGRDVHSLMLSIQARSRTDNVDKGLTKD